MRKGKHVIGQSVLAYNEGVKVDSVKDLLISETNDSIVGLLVDEGGLLSSSRVVPIENVNRFGKDAVIVETASKIVRASDDKEVNAIVSRKDSLLGKKVVTDQGQSMGTLNDMYFDDTSGRIEGFEVSGGLFGDIQRGTSFLPVNDIDRMGPDVIFIRPHVGEALENQVGGMQGALNDAGDRIGEAASSATESIQARVAEGQPEQALVGRRSGMDVTDADGRVVVANGERIRPEHVDWAKQNNTLGTLTTAATQGEASDARARASDGLESAGDAIASAWDRFQTRLGEMRDEQGRQADASQTTQRLRMIQDAIGRPVTKVILD